jgi:YesN/AraC family two-component response regulator
MTERPYLMLVVEDEPAIREGVLGTLKKWGEKQPDIWQFIAAASGPEGLEIARSRPVDFMICDIRLPGMSGIDMLDQLRREHCDTPAILLTGYAEFEYARKALSLGVVNYLLKPVDQVQLIEAVEAALEKEKIGSRRSREAESAVRRNETIRNALALIAERLKDPDFTLKELADRVHLHPNYLSTLFREVTGMTFSDYLTRQRLNMAKRLLLCTDKKIYTIAEETGFSTARYFIKVFRDFEGVTPKEFRAGRHPVASSADEDRRGAKGGR